jgi:hypothetical protein
LTEKHRVVFGRRLVKDDFKGETTSERRSNEANKNVVTKTDVHFLRVPAVVPTTQGFFFNFIKLTLFFKIVGNDERQQQSASNFDELVEGVDAENGQFHRLLESPSTATLRARREPFLLVDYALQVKKNFFNNLIIKINKFRFIWELMYSLNYLFKFIQFQSMQKVFFF